MVASPTSRHSAFAKILKVTKGSYLMCLSFWVPSTHLYMERFTQMCSRVPACSNALRSSNS